MPPRLRTSTPDSAASDTPRAPRCPEVSAPRRRYRRPLLGALALAALASPAISSGCAPGFTPASEIETLRVFAVTPSASYAAPGEEVTLTLSYHDGLIGPDDAARPIQIVWLGGCYNPPGSQYYGCYESLAETFASLAGDPTSSDLIGFGPTFTFTMPEDILDGVAAPAVGSRAGSAYVFFAVCAGQLGPVEDPGGRAGSFPIGCFDSEGRRLGADSFIPGYTQVFTFEDGRRNNNPAIDKLNLDDKEIPEDFGSIPSVKACPISSEERRQVGCSAPDIASECETHTLKVIVDADTVADPEEPTATEGSSGEDLPVDSDNLTEVVWVSYYTDQGELQGDTQLVNDAVKGYNPESETTWVPPPDPGVTTIWAVLRDARGGSSVIQRRIRVE